MTTKQETRDGPTTRCLRTVGAAAAGLALVAGTALGTAVPASASVAVAPAAAQVVHPPVHNPTRVESWCSTFLGRDSRTDPGASSWVGRLDRGDAPDAVLADLLRSREHVSGAVATIYRAYLGRGPDPDAVYRGDRVLRGDSTLEGVEQDVAGSDELTLATSGEGCAEDCTPGPGPVPTWYRAVLDREPSAGEVAYWEGRSAQVGDPDTFSEIWYTPEAVDHRVQTHDTGLLKRSAGAGELAYWYGPEVVSDAAVVALIATSDEFVDRFPI